MRFFNRKVNSTCAAFGAAMATLYVAPEIQSDEIEINFTPDFVDVNYYQPQSLAIDELMLGFRQWNDSIYKTVVADSLTSINMVKSGDVISPQNFSGSFLVDFIGMTSSTAFVGFRAAGNVGWFKMDLGGLFETIHYLDGRYANDGESLVVGGGKNVLLGDVNCDGLVNLLDVDPFVKLLTTFGYLDKADMNQDGAVDLLDVQPFVDELTN